MNELQTDYSKAILEQLVKISQQMQNLEPVPIAEWSKQDRQAAFRHEIQRRSWARVVEEETTSSGYKAKQAKKEAEKQAKIRRAIEASKPHDYFKR
jgi:hypothetical protein